VVITSMEIVNDAPVSMVTWKSLFPIRPSVFKPSAFLLADMLHVKKGTMMTQAHSSSCRPLFNFSVPLGLLSGSPSRHVSCETQRASSLYLQQSSS
jgi:hypothetical protein